ncbi:MAG: MFS transporter, partial [Pseudomonadota bacterium]
MWAWIASLLSRDPILIALMPVALRLPWFVFALPAGVLTDRMDRRQLIMLMDVCRASVFALAACVVWGALPLDPPATHGTSNPGLYLSLLVFAFIAGSAEVFRDNAAQTMLPALVSRHQLERANGRLWSVELIGNSLLGPALGAFLIAAILWLPFLFNAIAFAVASFLLFSIGGRFTPAKREVPDWRGELHEGISFLRSQSLLKLLAVITGLWNLLHQIVLIALVLYVQENLQLGVRGYGLILAAGALGGIAGGMLGDKVVRWMGQAGAAQWMLVASAVAFMVIPFAP